MQFSDSSPQFSVQKFGFIVMAPIALVLHGLFLLIPLAPEQKAKEPEKKEELQPVGSIAQLPLTTISASPTPQASASPAPQASVAPTTIVQSQPQTVTVRDTPQKSQQPSPQPTPTDNKKITPTPTPTPATPPITSASIISDVPGTQSCPGNLEGCYKIVFQGNIRKALEEKFERKAKDIRFRNDDDELSDDNYTVGFKIANQSGAMEYFYAVSATQLQKSSRRLNSEELKGIGITVM